MNELLKMKVQLRMKFWISLLKVRIWKEEHKMKSMKLHEEDECEIHNLDDEFQGDEDGMELMRIS
jgi:hypothetical protein